jgi:gluconate 2-dehydrogenase gamma chain
MRSDPLSRRDFLAASGALLEGAWVAAHLPAIRAAAQHARTAVTAHADFQVLTAREAAELDAITAQIFPTDETPGAREAGIVHFLDRALGDFASASLELIRAGLGDLGQLVAQRHPGAAAFADLPFEQQTALLQQIDRSDFFEAVRTLTVAGMFALPAHGGNRGQIGWSLLRLDPSPVFEPPFGYYDRTYVENGEGR